MFSLITWIQFMNFEKNAYICLLFIFAINILFLIIIANKIVIIKLSSTVEVILLYEVTQVFIFYISERMWNSMNKTLHFNNHEMAALITQMANKIFLRVNLEWDVIKILKRLTSTRYHKQICVLY